MHGAVRNDNADKKTPLLPAAAPGMGECISTTIVQAATLTRSYAAFRVVAIIVYISGGSYFSNW